MVCARIADDGSGAFSAHVEHAQRVGTLPALPATRAAATAPAPAGPATRWRATARTGWYRADRGDVAQRFQQALERAGGAVDATVVVGDTGFSTSFTVTSRSDLGAQEIAFELARDAWATLGVVAEPGVDFDVSRFEVTPAGTDAG